MKGASWAVLVALALSGCADEVVFALELHLEEGQAVADLETSKIYNGPGTFVLERRGAELEQLRAFRLAVYHGNNMASHEQTIGPMECLGPCYGSSACKPVTVVKELQRWRLYELSHPWFFVSGYCELDDGTQTFFVR